MPTMYAAFVTFSLLSVTSSATVMTIEAETSRGHHPTHHRDGASGLKAVYLREGDTMSFPFCLMQQTYVTVKSVGYSNDGDFDDISISIGKVYLGKFTSVVQYGGGAFWNNFKQSGQIGAPVLLNSGIHRIRLKVMRSDTYGVEVDNVLVDVEDSSITSNSQTFSCKLPCQQESYLLKSQMREQVSDGYMLQRSYPTTCAEEDNIDIPVFHNTVSAYTVTAMLPSYHSFLNSRTEDTSNCPFLRPNYWLFRNVALDQLLHSTPFVSNGATFGLSDSVSEGISTPFQFGVVFKLKGRSQGYIDSEIGSRIDLKLNGLTSPADVSVFYKGRADTFIKEPIVKFTAVSPYHTWNIKDFTWTESGDNEVILKISSSQSSGIVVEDFQMERRYMGPDKVFKMFQNDEVIIEGIEIDFWWRAPETMNIKLSTTGQTWNNVDYFRISYSVPWNNTWSQVFVMYQDGNVRLLPIVPLAVDWIPFGSSVIIGQTNAEDFRPSAPIRAVLINPETLTFDVTYMDGGRATLELSSLVERTELHVSNTHYEGDTISHPFATFRSMYVRDGFDDADSVTTDKEGPKHVMDGWTTMSGTSFLLHRRCQSDHLSQSPDVRLDINSA
ncbi:uncharacterized protein [Haliotis cracherodii]|uniref:uncharacterized protein n=1 Tax=Haliotis cracherodii TaxID=6455 RepID=UPI0039EA6892